MRRKTKGLRLYYMDLLWTAKKLNMIAKSPYISKGASWKASQQAKELMDLADFYKGFLDTDYIKENCDERNNSRSRR